MRTVLGWPAPLPDVDEGNLPDWLVLAACVSVLDALRYFSASPPPRLSRHKSETDLEANSQSQNAPSSSDLRKIGHLIWHLLLALIWLVTAYHVTNRRLFALTFATWLITLGRGLAQAAKRVFERRSLDLEQERLVEYLSWISCAAVSLLWMGIHWEYYVDLVDDDG